MCVLVVVVRDFEVLATLQQRISQNATAKLTHCRARMHTRSSLDWRLGRR